MDDQEWLNSQDSPEDRQEALSYLKTKARYNRRNKARYECPTCHTPNAISAWEKAHGYHCAACTRAAES